MGDIKGLTPHDSRVNETVSVATIPWRFAYLCWNIPEMGATASTEARRRKSFPSSPSAWMLLRKVRVILRSWPVGRLSFSNAPYSNASCCGWLNSSKYSCKLWMPLAK